MVSRAGNIRPTSGLTSYIRLARPDHWFKNVFLLPGSVLALMIAPGNYSDALVATLLALVALSLAASANYVINEWLDAGTDRFHPVKKNRPAVAEALNPAIVYSEYLALVCGSLLTASFINPTVFTLIAVFVAMGLIYNVRPIRAKDRAYLDVLTESINNPLRLAIGWSALIDYALPPSSVVLAYWMGGAFLMAAKRFAEYRMIGDPDRAALYRESFRRYSEESLLVSAFFYALCSAFFLGVFLIKYRIEFLLTFPLFALLFSWYLAISLRSESVVQTPEKLYREKRFAIFVGALSVAVTLLFFVDIPALQILAEATDF